MSKTLLSATFLGTALTVALGQPNLSHSQDADRANGNYRPEIGVPHPDFTLPRIDNGEAVSLRDFRGKKVLLIHFASW